MFERFTKEARATVVAAQQVARDTASRRVDTRHLMVALVEQPGPAYDALQAVDADVGAITHGARAELRAHALDGDALATVGIDLEAVRREADAVFGEGALDRAGRGAGGHIPFAPDARKALELSLREAIRLKQRTIHSGHLLLGVLRADCPGRELLLHAGIDTDTLRRALEETRAA